MQTAASLTATSPASVPPIADLKAENIVRVYSGRPGCGCGCRGKYTANDGNNPAQITRILNTMKARGGEVEAYPTTSGGDEYNAIYSLQDDQRYRWIYAKV